MARPPALSDLPLHFALVRRALFSVSLGAPPCLPASCTWFPACMHACSQPSAAQLIAPFAQLPIGGAPCTASSLSATNSLYETSAYLPLRSALARVLAPAFDCMRGHCKLAAAFAPSLLAAPASGKPNTWASGLIDDCSFPHSPV